jgi:hypothetical protein
MKYGAFSDPKMINNSRFYIRSDSVDEKDSADIRHKLEIYQRDTEHRFLRIEEKHDDAIKAIDKLSSKVEALGESIKRAAYIGVGGGGVIYFLSSGLLPKIITAGGG